MRQSVSEKRAPTLLAGVLILVCSIVVVLALTSGAAYAGIRQARTTAARASIGQIESTLLLAEHMAAEEGHTPPAGAYQYMLRSYVSAEAAALTDFEKAVLNNMLEQFGTMRDFDFALTRYHDGAGNHTQIYYFPTGGRTDAKRDHYYVSEGKSVTEVNG